MVDEALIEVRDAVFGYAGRPVVQANALELHPGRCLGIFGPNGAGKTTMVRGITGLLAPMSGHVGRRSTIDIGYLPQHRAMDMHWPMTGFDAAALAVSARRRIGWLSRGDRAQVRESMKTLDVESFARRPFAKLSGGQQQRILLAGALATDPHVLVLDEPTDGLDVRSRRGLLEILAEHNARGLCTVLISHEVEDLLATSDQIAWLHRPDDALKPSHVEVIAPDELAERVAHARQLS
jgi:ABC-type Mn2+/Zn2+ transport system ATPase subunit